MRAQRLRPNMAMILIAFAVLFGLMLACARLVLGDSPGYWTVSGQVGGAPATAAIGLIADSPQATQTPRGPILTPTPDAPHPLPALRIEPDYYVVQAGDTLAEIARQYNVSLSQLVDTNSILNPDLVEVGQGLTIPVPTPEGSGPDFKVIPDSELVYGPGSVGFDVGAFVADQAGYLASYHEDIDGRTISGAQIVQRVSQEFSVNPRLLLAVLEYQSQWVTNPDPKVSGHDFPIGVQDAWRKGLYRQLAFAADNLNRGFYLWRVNGVAAWLLNDGGVVPVAPTINAGTAGVQQFFATLYGRSDWEQAVGENGLFATFNALFGYPFDRAIEPLLPAGLAQPALQLPFEPGQEWAFTGGPHGGWGDGSAWAALDFAPPSDALGCVPSDAWVVAAADGLILRTGTGDVIQDLDGDGLEQTGWVLLYMHVESRERVQAGTYLQAGERIGHPSCEGGVSTGTHMHLARRYNGEWIPADQELPFILDGWVSSGDGFEYNGFLKRNGTTVEAYAGRSPDNGIQR